MKQFVLVYLGGNQPTSPEEANAHYKKYTDWLASLEGAIVIPTIPLKDTHTVRSKISAEAGGSSAMSGFTIIKAESLDEAIQIAQNCPFLEIGGTLEVSELMQMPVQ